MAIQRISGRIACKKCGRPYHRQFDPPDKEGACNACGGDLFQRDDDRVEVVRKRLEVYRTQTFPLIEYYRAKGVLKEINSQQEKSLVFQEVISCLSLQSVK
jgi:adenylate kinase